MAEQGKDVFTPDAKQSIKTNWNYIPATEYMGNPCPAGWRIPTVAELAGLIENIQTPVTVKDKNDWDMVVAQCWGASKSTDTEEAVMLPYAGHIVETSGYGPSSIGSIGCYWASDLKDGKPSILRLYKTTYNIWDYDRRACGFSIRCVRQ